MCQNIYVIFLCLLFTGSDLQGLSVRDRRTTVRPEPNGCTRQSLGPSEKHSIVMDALLS